MRALDLFCGAGGAGRGLADAGFDVVGVDIKPQPNYPFRFIQCDALLFLTSHPERFDFNLYWASPPCQRYSAATRQNGTQDTHPDLVDPVRRALTRMDALYVIENVEGAPLVNPVKLCGAMFDLGVIRHRLFEANWPLPQPKHVKHKGSLVTGEYVTVAGNGGVPAWTMKERERRGLPRHIPGEWSMARWSAAMDISWMTRGELVEAIPPAYSKYIGEEFVKWHKVRPTR